MSYLWNTFPAPVFTQGGQFASGALAYFYTAGTTTPLVVYADAAFTIPYTAPVVADDNGIFPPVFIPYGSYRVRILDSSFALISNADNIDNPAPPSSGGGIVVTQDQIFQTGDSIWLDKSGLRNGWVRRNANTIGSAASAATELASATTQNLFLYLWANYSNTDAPVGGGRGASGAADFAANKVIGIPTMQGYGISGLDDMGGTAAGRLQAITTCTTNNTKQLLLVSAAGVAVGMNAIVNGAAAGTVAAVTTGPITTVCSTNGTADVTVACVDNLVIGMTATINAVGGRTITNIVGLVVTVSSAVGGTATNLSFVGSWAAYPTITMSGVVAGAAAGISFRASVFADAQVAAGAAGSLTVKQTADQIGVHSHSPIEVAHTHTTAANGFQSAAPAGGINFLRAGGSDPTGSTLTGITNLPSAGGNPMSVMTPTRLGTFYMKL